jgi:hypothetical protein
MTCLFYVVFGMALALKTGMKRWKRGHQVLLCLGVAGAIFFFPLPGAEPHCCLAAALVNENPTLSFSEQLDGYFFPWGVGWWSSLAVVFVIYTQLRRQ